MDDKAMISPDGSRVEWFTKSHKHYLNKTTVLYGKTDSGKTTVLYEIMDLCKEYIPGYFVISPTDIATDSFKNRIPDSFIFEDLNIEWIESLVERQRHAADIYKKSNNIKILQRLFSYVACPMAKKMESAFIINASKYTMVIDSDTSLTFAEKENQKTDIIAKRDTLRRKLYKKHITIRKNELNKKKLTQDETTVLKFLNYNPNIMLILDDCASSFNEWYKKTTAFKTIFYQGRHLHMTVIITTQDDKEIKSELRKNTRVSIFTEEQSAISNFERKSNGYPKHIRKQAQTCIKKVFEPYKNKKKNHQKLVYINGANPFQYTIANLLPFFAVGCPGIWELDKKARETKSAYVSINPLLDKYT
jgi:hypothetical protein